MKHLLAIEGLTRDEATALLDDAAHFSHLLAGRVVRKLPTLRGRTVVTLFYENSTRTRVSFEIAGKWMSADVINVSASSSSTAKGESLRDTALTLRAAGADVIVVRHPASGAAQRIAQWTAEPGGGGPSVVNAGDGTHEHPTQALLDALTLRERLGALEGKRVGIVGDLLHSRVARSGARLFALLGMEVVLVAPPTLIPAGFEGGGIRVSSRLDDELGGLDAVMALRLQAERMNGGFFPSLREYSTLYGLSPKRLDQLKEEAVVMHPGPMNRGVEISDAAADSERSTVLQQVRNGVHVRMAVLYRLLAGAPSLPASEAVPSPAAKEAVHQ
ncbi:aspartate carbamoyltransferase catalytic subunit [Segniliparus rugosus]|uniref:Aspartate carbamoyltransferase n=1 Tax=Segniliparus rugosus (strain ATCC BAA-974 / DSM 45345 / CCUG 50838 / CIP 108380 / JCM 13579 / CDC 945) TaxID=679197 RepID=E5XL10_SEGRC|nr:aspartate carbamoyltransferase catalytic subunit [Segniliparus rugosus]EFV14992.1 aspartate carbamoyltransferase [Segniliparus rugosus ATCC BAA-974]